MPPGRGREGGREGAHWALGRDPATPEQDPSLPRPDHTPHPSPHQAAPHPTPHTPPAAQDGINAQWQAFYFSNARFPLANVTLNQTPLQRDEFGFWIHPQPLATPCRLQFTSQCGATVSASVDDPLTPQVLEANFEPSACS